MRRRSFIDRAKGLDFDTPSFVNEFKSVPSSVKRGRAVYIFPGSMIMSNAVVSDYAVMSTGVKVAHDAIAVKGCLFASGSNIGREAGIAENAIANYLEQMTNPTIRSALDQFRRGAEIRASKCLSNGRAIAGPELRMSNSRFRRELTRSLRSRRRLSHRRLPLSRGKRPE